MENEKYNEGWVNPELEPEPSPYLDILADFPDVKLERSMSVTMVEEPKEQDDNEEVIAAE